MSNRNTTHRYSTPLKLGFALAILLIPFATAQAYVGPGAGLSLLSALWGLLCAIGAALLFVVVWPLRRLRRKRREARQANESNANRSNSGEQQSDEA